MMKNEQTVPVIEEEVKIQDAVENGNPYPPAGHAALMPQRPVAARQTHDFYSPARTLLKKLLSHPALSLYSEPASFLLQKVERDVTQHSKIFWTVTFSESVNHRANA